MKVHELKVHKNRSPRRAGRGIGAGRGKTAGRGTKGQGSRKISVEMGLSMKTVQAYSARIKEKLGLSNVSELIREAVRWTETKRNN